MKFLHFLIIFSDSIEIFLNHMKVDSDDNFDGSDSSMNTSGMSLSSYENVTLDSDFINSFLDDEHFCDLTFCVGKLSSNRLINKVQLLRIPVHKCVLASASSVLDKLLSDQSEIIMVNVEPIVFLLIVK